MPITEKRAILACPCEQVWKVVTSLTETSWRSDISRCEVIEPGKRFVEYTNTGVATAFTITACEPMHRYEFDMENGKTCTAIGRACFTNAARQRRLYLPRMSRRKSFFSGRL